MTHSRNNPGESFRGRLNAQFKTRTGRKPAARPLPAGASGGDILLTVNLRVCAPSLHCEGNIRAAGIGAAQPRRNLGLVPGRRGFDFGRIHTARRRENSVSR